MKGEINGIERFDEAKKRASEANSGRIMSQQHNHAVKILISINSTGTFLVGAWKGKRFTYKSSSWK